MYIIKNSEDKTLQRCDEMQENVLLVVFPQIQKCNVSKTFNIEVNSLRNDLIPMSMAQ